MFHLHFSVFEKKYQSYFYGMLQSFTHNLQNMETMVETADTPIMGHQQKPGICIRNESTTLPILKKYTIFR